MPTAAAELRSEFLASTSQGREEPALGFPLITREAAPPSWEHRLGRYGSILRRIWELDSPLTLADITSTAAIRRLGRRCFKALAGGGCCSTRFEVSVTQSRAWIRLVGVSYRLLFLRACLPWLNWVEAGAPRTGSGLAFKAQVGVSDAVSRCAETQSHSVPGAWKGQTGFCFRAAASPVRGRVAGDLRTKSERRMRHALTAVATGLVAQSYCHTRARPAASALSPGSPARHLQGAALYRRYLRKRFGGLACLDYG